MFVQEMIRAACRMTSGVLIPLSGLVLFISVINSGPVSASSGIEINDAGKIFAGRAPENSREFLPVNVFLFPAAVLRNSGFQNRETFWIYEILSVDELFFQQYCSYFKYIPVQNFILRINCNYISGRAGPVSC